MRFIAIIVFVSNYAYYTYYCNDYLLFCCRMVGFRWISSGIRAWLQETCPVRHSHSKHPGQTSCGTCWRHWNYSPPHAQRLCERSWRPQAGCKRWMPDVVRQLVGTGMVPWHVINLTGLQRAKPQGERLHVNMTPWPCLGHDTVSSGCPLTILLGSLGCESAR